MKKKLLIISEVFYPEESATSYFMTGIAKFFAKSYDLSVLTNSRLQHFNELNNLDIYRIKSPRFNLNLLGRYLRVFFSTATLGFKALFLIKKNSIVLVVTNPPLLPGYIALICKIKHAKCIIRVDDLHPDAMVVINKITKNSFFYHLLIYAFRGLFFLADSLVVLGMDTKRLLVKENPSLKRKIKIIQNWSETDSVFPMIKIKSNMAIRLGLTKKFTILIAGNIGYVQGADTILESMIQLKSFEIHFLFVGSGSIEGWLRNEVQKHGLTKVYFEGLLPKKQQNDFLNSCDIALLALKKGMLGLGVPSRFYNYLAAGKPTIASVNKKSEIAKDIINEGLGWVVGEDNAIELSRTILNVSRLPKLELDVISNRCRDFAVSKYSQKKILNKYQSLFEEI